MVSVNLLMQIFWDLSSDYQDNTAPLLICDDDVLGKGGFGLVCKGEISGNVSRGGEPEGEGNGERERDY